MKKKRKKKKMRWQGVIKDIVDHVIHHDKEELSDLLMELRDEVGK